MTLRGVLVRGVVLVGLWGCEPGGPEPSPLASGETMAAESAGTGSGATAPPAAAGPGGSRADAVSRPDGAPANPAGSPPARSTRESVGPPIELRPPILDLGLLGQAQKANCRFEVVNLSDQPLRVTRIEGSCGCLSFFYDRRELAPGESQFIDVTVGTSNRAGKVLTATVRVNDPGYHSQVAEIRYYTRPLPVSDPPQATFGRCDVTGAPPLRLTLRYQLPSSIEVAEPQAVIEEGLPLEVEVLPATRRPSGAIQMIEQPLILTLTATEPGVYRGHVEVESTVHETLEIPFFAQLHNGWYLDRDRIHLGQLKSGRRKSYSVRVVSTRQPVPQFKVECASPDVKVSVERDAGGAVFEVVAAPQEVGAWQAEVKVTDPDTGESQTLTLEAQVREA